MNHSLPVYSLLMLGGQELLMARPGSGNPWLPYISRRLPDTGSYRVVKRHHSSHHKDASWTDWGAQRWRVYRVGHLESRVHEPQNVFAVARLQADDVINHIIHLRRTRLQVSVAVPGQLMSTAQTLTSFSQLELRLSRALGLLGALLPGPGGMPCSGGWLGHWLAVLPPRVVDRYCLTCCLWACWMWYLEGFSRWGCTYRSRTSALRHCCICKHLQDLFRHVSMNKAGEIRAFIVLLNLVKSFSWFTKCWT